MRFPLLLAPALLTSALQAQAPVDDAARGRLVEDIAEVLVDNYVFPEIGEQIADRILGKLVDGGYDRFENGYDLAEELTRDLQSVNGDGHFRVHVVDADARAEPTPEELRAQRERRADRTRRGNYGFQRVEILPGNVGYIDLRQFSSAGAGGPTAVAAMKMVENTDAVIFDLRQNGGGDPGMVQLLCSYFLPEDTHLNSFFRRGQEQLDQFWTLPHIPGERRLDVPLFVVTSRRTGSAAEEFSYNLRNLERATLVGEVTGGAANPGGTHPVGHGFAVFVSDGRAINPITGTNWEGVGVKPHLPCAAPEALERAHLEALRAIEERLGPDDERHPVEWARAALEAKAKPVALAAEALAPFAGSFGARRIELRDGELYYAPDAGRMPLRLVPLAADLFELEGNEFFRVHFPDGDTLVGIYADGRREASPRTQ